MIKAILEIKRIDSRLIADSLYKFSKKYSIEWKIDSKLEKNVARIIVNDMRALNEIHRRIGHFKNIEFVWRLIEPVDKQINGKLHG